MNNTTLKVSLFSTAAFVLSAVPGFAQQTGHLSVKVPFEFAAGSTLLPAGEYDFHEEQNGVVLITSPALHKSVLVLTNPESVTNANSRATLHFDKTGGQYSLTEVDMAGEPGRKLVKLDRDPNAAALTAKLGVTNAASKGIKK